MPEFATPEPISVTIELAMGAVHVIATDRADTVVAVNAADPRRQADLDAAAETQVDFDAGRLVIRGPTTRGIGKLIGPTRRSGCVDLTVELPSGSHVHSDAAVGEFRGDGRLGDVTVKVGVGSIRVDHAAAVRLATSAGSLTLDRATGGVKATAAGPLILGNVDGDVAAKNLNGTTSIGTVAGALRVRSANGDISIAQAGTDVDAKTANGSIRIGEIVRGTVALQTASGALDIGIRSGTAAWVDARSQYGRVANTLERTDAPAAGMETVQLRARTAAGDITIRRPEPAVRGGASL